MFPKLFGGGFAKLNLQDDSEDSGLVLMARLPGKKNTKLSQLSGGEKALTALALVFSLFSSIQRHFVYWMRLMHRLMMTTLLDYQFGIRDV